MSLSCWKPKWRRHETKNGCPARIGKKQPRSSVALERNLDGGPFDGQQVHSPRRKQRRATTRPSHPQHAARPRSSPAAIHPILDQRNGSSSVRLPHGRALARSPGPDRRAPLRHRNLRHGRLLRQQAPERIGNSHRPGRAAQRSVASSLGRALKLLAVGSTAGLLLGILASRVLASVVYQATPRDPVVLAGVVLAMLLLGLLATWIPARRALAIDPAILMRED